MLALRYAVRWRIGGIALLVVVLAAALAPLHLIWPVTPGPAIPYLDKWVHGIAFALLALWFSGQYARHAYWPLVAGLVGFGVLIEVVQSMISYRSAEWLDLAADVAGLGVGMGIALAGFGGWSLRVEDWLRQHSG